MESSFTCLLFIWLCWVFFVTHGVFDSCGRWVPSCGTWELVPWSGIEPGPLHWECGVLATGPPEKSLVLHFTLATLKKKKKKQVTLILTIFYLILYAQMVIISIFFQYKELLMKYLTFFFFLLTTASLMRWMWVWTNSGSWWWTEKPGVLQSMGVQRVRHNWATELNWSLWNLVWILHP